MATVLGTGNNDYIHPDDGTPAPAGYVDDPQHTTNDGDTIDASQGALITFWPAVTTILSR